MDTDNRIGQIHRQIRKYIDSEYTVRESVSDKRDEIDAVIASLNTLGERLIEKKDKAGHDDERIQALMNLLLKYTVMDFSDLAAISDNHDEIDAIAAGLNALNEEFRHSMEVRNSYEEELIAKANLLEAANKEMEAFTYTVSHDLRSPLRAIHGYSQLLLEDFGEHLNDEGHRILKSVMANAQRMSKLIDDLLEFSRLGRKQINKVEVEPGKLAANVYRELAGQNSRTDIRIHPMPAMIADYALMTQVYQNLIGNALKFSSNQQTPRVEIGSTITEQGRTYYVKDNGAGFDMAYYDKMFGVFQRLHRDEEFEGTGVGLAIVKRILHRHGGDIWAEGVINKGASFYFTTGNQNQ